MLNGTIFRRLVAAVARGLAATSLAESRRYVIDPQHTCGAQTLDVESHPEMIFTSPGWTLVDRKGSLMGELTIRAVTRPLTLEVTWNKSGVSPLPGEPYVAGTSAWGSFRRSEFGLTCGVADGLVGDEVEIVIELEAHRQ